MSGVWLGVGGWLGKVLLTGCGGLMLAGPVTGADRGVDASQQRLRIAAQRDQANMLLADRERACLPRFLVAPCIDAARAQQRSDLKRLRDEEVALDQAQRDESAARRREALAGKAAARRARGVAVGDDAAASQRAAASTSAASSPPEKKMHLRGEAASPPSANDARRRAEIEAKNVAAFESRVKAAQAHRDAVALRNARRLDAHPGAGANQRSAPLPIPKASAGPASAP
jgi:hypothetical protein